MLDVINVRLMNPTGSRQLNEWHTSCLGLLKEPWLLLKSTFFPCGAYKDAVESFLPEEVGWLDSVFGGICFLCGFDLRVRFREELKLEGSREKDFCLHLFCNGCSLAQIQREARYWQNEIKLLCNERRRHPPPGPLPAKFEVIPETSEPITERVPSIPQYLQNAGVVTIVPTGSNMTRDETASIEARRRVLRQRSRESTMRDTANAVELAGLHDLEGPPLPEILALDEGESSSSEKSPSNTEIMEASKR